MASQRTLARRECASVTVEYVQFQDGNDALLEEVLGSGKVLPIQANHRYSIQLCAGYPRANIRKPLMRRFLVVFETGAEHFEEQGKRAGSGEPALCGIGLLRGSGCRDRLQAQRNNLGPDHFSRDDQLDAAVLLTPLGRIV
jgi:hypothetical protein